ncbi:MAG: hypothetical protein OHK0024_14240 [Thalassobaculales bacterium]
MAADISGHEGQDAGVPLYERLKRRLSENILMGVWPPGTVIPGEERLAADYGLAVGTVRRALADLAAEGLLARRPKRGTVVTGRAPHHSLRFFFQYFRLHGRDGSLLRSSVEMLGLSAQPATAEEARRLEVPAGDMLVVIERLRLVSGQPVMLDNFRLLAARVPGFPTEQAAVPELIYRHLLDRYGIRVTAVREELEARLADAQERRLLALPDPAAVLVIDGLAIDQSGRPCALVRQVASTAHHRYVNEVR